MDRTRDKQLESIRIPVVVEPAAGETTQHQCAMEQAADFSAETTQHQSVMEPAAAENQDASQEIDQHQESRRRARLVQRPARFQDYFM